MSNNTINILHDKDKELKRISESLSRMSDVFYVTGNEMIGADLSIEWRIQRRNKSAAK